MDEMDVLDEAEAVMGGKKKVKVVGKADDLHDHAALSELNSMIEGTGGGSSGGSALPDAVTLRRDVKSLQRRIRMMNACLLNPTSKLMQYWDFATLSALFYTATITPYEVCLMWDEVKFVDGSWLNWLFFANWFINIIFIVDICFNFFLPFREPIKRGGGTVKSHKRIWRNYLYGWFGLDLISVLPIDTVMMTVDTSNLGASSSMLKAIRMLRLLRLIKLARILRASRIFSRWENSISLSYAKQDLVKWTLIISILLHWLACALGLIAQLMSAPRSPELANAVAMAVESGMGNCWGCMPDDNDTAPDPICNSYCLTSCEVWELAHLQLPGAHDEEVNARMSRLVAEQNWVCRYAEAGKVSPPTWHGEVWVAALYIALIQLGGGVGSIVPENFAEYIVFICGILLGSVTWAMVVGTICATMATGDPHTNAFKQNMDSLNYFLDDMNMPTPLRLRAREYLRNTRDLYKKASYNELITRMSPDLKADIVLHMSAKTLEQVWYLGRGLEQACRVELALHLERCGFAPREKVSSLKLCILMRGVAAKAGNILTPSSHWGDDVIVSSPALRDLRPASALTYVEVATLAREDMMSVLENFPISAAVIRQAAMKVAMRRAVVIISEYVRSRQELKGHADQASKAAKAAHSSLTSVFGHSDDPSADDPTMILRIITGNNLRDVVDGQLVEEVGDEPPLEGENKVVVEMLQDSKQEAAVMKREMKAIKGELAELKDMMRALVSKSLG